MSDLTVHRALVSVSDKTGLVEFCRRLAAAGVEIVSSGGTAAELARAGIGVTLVSDVTGHPEILGGRVKTLHPRIHGGILANRFDQGHARELEDHGIEPFQLVVTNLYPFEATVASGADDAAIIEDIDIGGPAMVRAAAKNHQSVGVVTSPDQYPLVADAIERGGMHEELLQDLARAAFFLTASYDAAIVDWMEGGSNPPERAVVALESAGSLRYGENPHQGGVRYRRAGHPGWWESIIQHGGMELSYLNLLDVDAAWTLVHDLGDRPAAAIIKHANPCGVAIADEVATAYRQAYECDTRSAFGGIVAVNRVVDESMVEAVEAAAQADVIIAPAYAPGVVERIGRRRKNTRIMEAGLPSAAGLEIRQLSGGWLGQTGPGEPGNGWKVVTRRAPTALELADAEFAWKVCAHVKSNAIVLASGGTAWGIGAGQQNRVESTRIAVEKAAGRASGGACASDAFYPFSDGVEAAAESGVAVIVQPGGAMRDSEVIETADRLGLAMLFTGERRFLH